MGDIDAAGLRGHVIFLDVVQGTAYARVPQTVEKKDGGAAHTPDEVVKLNALHDAEAEEARARDAENTVRAARDAADVVGQRDTHDLHDADGHDQEIVAAQMNDGPRHHEGDERGGEAGHGHGPENGPVEHGIEDGRHVGANGVEGRVAHVENAGLTENDIERKREDGVKADAHAHVSPVGVEEKRQHENKHGHADAEIGPPVLKIEEETHSLSAVRSPRRPVGRIIRMRMSTRKATTSFQATAM